MNMKVEICASNFESAHIAQECGADRIELCTNLGIGGTTPSEGLIDQVKTELSIPVHVLVRPRGGDFVFSKAEFRQMLAAIHYCKESGCSGIVSGVLLPNNEIDTSRTHQLIAACEGMEFTFHRAFDLCPDAPSAFDTLLSLGVDRLLSSGQATTAVEGIPLLKTLLDLSDNRIEIMPGAGINESNAQLFKEAGFLSVHLSAIKRRTTVSNMFDTGIEGASDSETIKKVIEIVH